MSGFSNFVNQYLGAIGIGDQKKTEVASASEAKRAALGGAQPTNYQLGASAFTGKGQASASQIERDLATLSQLQFDQKYGDRVAESIRAGQAQGIADYDRDSRITRTGPAAVGDTLNTIGSTFLSLPANVAALGVGAAEAGGLAPVGSGAAVARGIAGAQDWARSKQSEALQARRRTNAARQSLDERDNQARYDAVPESERTLLNNLSQIGRDALAGIGNTVSDPLLLADGTAGAIGSLLAGGVAGKVVGATLKGAAAPLTSRMAVGAAGPSQAGAVLAERLGQAGLPAATAAFGAGSIYQGTADAVLEAGGTPTEANQGGLAMAPFGAGVGLVTGKISQRFEANPLRVGSVRAGAGNVLTETLEEGVEEGVEQFGQNLSVKALADPNQALSQGLGNSIGQGMLFGATGAAAIQTPGLAGEAVAGAGRVAKGAVSTLVARGERIQNQTEQKRLAEIASSREEAVAQAPVLEQQLMESLGAADPKMAETISTFFGQIRFDPAEAQNEPEPIRNAVGQATNRYEAIANVTNLLMDQKASAPDKLAAAGFIVNQYRNGQTAIDENLIAIAGAMDDSNPQLPEIMKFAEAYQTVNSEEVGKAIKAAMEAVKAPEVLQTFSDQAMSTPEGQQRAQSTADALVELAVARPESVPAELIDVVRRQESKGILSLTPEKVAVLKAAYSQVQATKEFLEQKAASGLTGLDHVTGEIQANNKRSRFKSAHMHAAEVMDAFRKGDMMGLTQSLEDFGYFAQHLQNKLQAVNESARTGGKAVPFQALSPERQPGQAPEWYTGAPVRYVAGKPNSVNFGKAVELDAQAVAKLYNGLVEAFPQAGLQPIESGSLQVGSRAPAKQEAKAEPEKKTTEPALKSEPVVEKATEKPAEPKVSAKEEDVQNQEEDDDTTPPWEEPTKPEPKPVKAEEKPAPEPAEPKPEPVKSEPKAVKEKTKVEEPQTKPEAVKAVSKADRFGSLLGSREGANFFVKAFKDPAEPKTRLGDRIGTLFGDLLRAVTSKEGFEDFTGKSRPLRMDEDAVDAYEDLFSLVPKIRKELEKQLQNFLNEKHNTKSKATIGDAIMTGLMAGTDPVTAWRRGKALNLVELKAGDAFGYNDELIRPAIAATLQWLIRTYVRNSGFQKGVPATRAIQDLSDMISRYWGMDVDRNMPEGFTKGIPDAIAGELIHALTSREVGMLEIRQIPYVHDLREHEGEEVIEGLVSEEGVQQGELINAFFLKDPDNDSEIFDLLAAHPDLIEEAVLIEPELTRYIGEPPTKVDELQLRNDFVRNTREQKEMIDREQKVPHQLNLPVVNFYKALGLDNILTLFGAGIISKDDYNINEFKSLEGKNRTIRGAFESLISTAAQMRAYADANDMDLADVPIFYRYAITKVGRLMMVGDNNPQASKLMREAILPTRAVMDLTDPVQLEKFLLAVGQAWGLKVNKMKRADVAAEVMKMATPDPETAGPDEVSFAEALEIFDRFLDGDGLTSQDVKDLRAIFGGDLTPVAIHAGIEMARYFRASDDEKKAFTTHIYVEADGITNGPINTLVHLSSGWFSRNWLRLVAKGGLYLGPERISAADYIGNPKSSGARVDLYQQAADFAQKALVAQHMGMSNKPKQMSSAMMQVITTLLPDVRINENGDIVIDRKGTKNPLTVVTYGASVNGVASKISEQLMARIYEEASKQHRGEPNELESLAPLIQKLTETRTIFSKRKGRWFTFYEPTGVKDEADPRKFTFSDKQIENLKVNVSFLYAQPMLDAINRVMQETKKPRELLRKMVQVQSIMAQYWFQELVRRKLEDKPAPDRKNFLSRVEIQEIEKDLLKIVPVIKTKSQAFFPAKRQLMRTTKSRNEKQARYYELGADFQDRFRMNAEVYTPVDAGVSGIPSIVIGMGDGLMIQILSLMEDSPLKKLLIYDGVHLPLDTLDEDGVKVNEAQYRSWLANPFAPVLQSYESFLSTVKIPVDLDKKLREALSQALTDDKYEVSDPKEFVSLLQELAKEAEEQNEWLEARHRVMGRIEMSVDQMASIEAPYQPNISNPILTEGMTEDEKIEALNNELQKEIDNIRDKKGSKKQKFADMGVMISDQLTRVLSKSDISNQQLTLLEEVVGVLGSDWKIVRGSPNETAEYLRRHGIRPEYASPGKTLDGYIKTADKVIVLHNDSVETLLHELVHAAVTTKIVAHYRGEGTPETATAVSNLEKLMDEWLSLDPAQTDMDLVKQQALRSAQKLVNDLRFQGSVDPVLGPAAAIDEFLTWNLSNQDLIEANQQLRVKNPIVRITLKAIRALKTLIWGKDMGRSVSGNFYNALRFNASLIINAAPTLQDRATNISRFQSRDYGTSDRLTDLSVKLDEKINGYLNAVPKVARLDEQHKIIGFGQKAEAIAQAFDDAGFTLSPQERSVFHKLVSVFAVQMKMDPAVLGRVQELYAYINDRLDETMMLGGLQTTDTALTTPALQKLAALRGMGVNGKSIIERDAEGRSSLMPAFLALAMTNSEFRAVLSKMPLPKSEKSNKDGLDGVLFSLGSRAMDELSRSLSGEKRNTPDVLTAIDLLTHRLADDLEAQESVIARVINPVTGVVGGANDRLVGFIQTRLDEGYDKLDKIEKTSFRKAARVAARAAKIGVSALSIERSKALGEAMLKASNMEKVPDFVRSAVNDIVGRTMTNAPIFDLIKPVRSYVQQARQQAREFIPNLIASKFSRQLTKDEWTDMFMGLARTDLGALMTSRNAADVMKLIADDRARKAEISRLESVIRKEASTSDAPRILQKSEQLAEFMNTRKKGEMLLRNAVAVANLFGVRLIPSNKPASARLVKAVDDLVSLYALDRLEPRRLKTLANLVGSEAAGLAYVLDYLGGQRQGELDKSAGPRAVNNHYKGYVPSLAQSGVQVVVMPDRDEAALKLKGYVKLDRYRGHVADTNREPLSYYYSPLSGRAAFSSGVMQNVRSTFSGVDPVTGFTHDSVLTAGVIGGFKAVGRLARGGAAMTPGEEPMPIFDEDGNVVAFERGVKPEYEARLNQDTNLARMLGAWRGRQIEEGLATEFNRSLIDRLNGVYEDALKSGDAKDFVNVLDPKALKEDPVLADAVKLFTPETLEYIEEVFGEGVFMIRRDMINDAIGYRQASVGDMWTGVTRVDPKVREVSQKVAIGVFGAEAYKYFTVGEKLIQNLATVARQTIVVRSVVVPVSNFVANIYHLASRGVSLARIGRDMPRKLAEIRSYVKRRYRELELEADLRASEGDVIRSRQIRTELTAIRDANMRMSIWPLIEAGEFTSISEAGSLEKEELSLYEGRLSEYLSKKLDKLPKPLKTAARYGLITDDTPLFQGMAHAMSYGDFLGKAIYYDHLIQEKKNTSDQALGKVGEEFVNYDRLTGRVRGYAENIGLLWFYNFKLRIMKVAMSTLRENPLQVLLASLVPTPPLIGSVGLPMTDSFASLLLRGDLGWSIGPEMGLNSWQMHPLGAMVN